MNSRLRTYVVTMMIAVLAPVQTLAVCANLADTTSPTCIQALSCQKTIHSEAIKYIASVQAAANKLIAKSLDGTNNIAQVYRCVGGVNHGQKCIGNNGGCSLGKLKAPCNVAADCGAGGVCNFGPLFGCNSKSATIAPVTLDASECQPDQATSGYSSDIVTAAKLLRQHITAHCAMAGVDPDDIGLAGIAACPAAATAGFCTAVVGTPRCTSTAQCSAGACVPDAGERFSALIDCVGNAAVGDFSIGELFDANLNVFRRGAGSGAVAPKAKHTAAGGPADPLPRQLWRLTGARLAQVGAGEPSSLGDEISANDAVQALSLSQCSGGNGKPACLNNADCGGGVCVANAGGETARVATGVTTVHKCCDAGASVGISCRDDSDCSGGACSVNAACSGNITDVVEVVNATGPFCLVSRAMNAGNGTAAKGTVNLDTGAFTTLATPITTDLFGGSCPLCVADPSCTTSPKVCCANDQTRACSSASSNPTDECLPAGGPIARIPNPFVLTTGAGTLVATTAAADTCGFCDLGPANGVCDSPPCAQCLATAAPCTGGRTCDTTTLPSKAFCGFCSDSIKVGCQATADCVAAGLSGPCSFANVAPGFHGDCATTSISVQGEANEYAPALAGVFCTGKTGNGLVDAAVGLPGPVRIKQALVLGSVFSTDK